jgi:hypothetical protein
MLSGKRYDHGTAMITNNTKMTRITPTKLLKKPPHL